ncbi:hypothetical protein HRR73_008765 [Exophiala dermatitidis]|nr:hypothetical protein HRR73_008765 [Exophiala dermatitidis]
MPLEEIHPNVQRIVSSLETKADNGAPTASATSLRSSAVQSMLRTTTELEYLALDLESNQHGVGLALSTPPSHLSFVINGLHGHDAPIGIMA